MDRYAKLRRYPYTGIQCFFFQIVFRRLGL